VDLGRAALNPSSRALTAAQRLFLHERKGQTQEKQKEVFQVKKQDHNDQ